MRVPRNRARGPLLIVGLLTAFVVIVLDPVSTARFAAVTMLGQDLAMTLLVQAESRDKVTLAAVLDAVGCLMTLATLHWSLAATDAGLATRTGEWVIAAVTVANFLGTGGATWIGKRFIRDAEKEELRRFKTAVLAKFPDLVEAMERVA